MEELENTRNFFLQQEDESFYDYRSEILTLAKNLREEGTLMGNKQTKLLAVAIEQVFDETHGGFLSPWDGSRAFKMLLEMKSANLHLKSESLFIFDIREKQEFYGSKTSAWNSHHKVAHEMLDELLDLHQEERFVERMDTVFKNANSKLRHLEDMSTPLS